MAKPRKSTSTRELIPVGTHVAICKAVADLGTQTPSNPDWDDRPVILFLYELTALSKKDAPVYITQQLTDTYKSKGLIKLLGDWMNVDAKEVKNFDLAECLGQPAMVKVKHSEDGNYANIATVMEVVGKVKIPKGFMPEVACFLDETFNEDDFEMLPEWIRDKAMDSPQYADVTAPRGKRGAKPVAKGKRKQVEEEDEDEAPAHGKAKRVSRR